MSPERRDQLLASNHVWIGKVMHRIIGILFLFIASAIALLTVPIATAKKAADIPSAPIPTQVLTGKKVFISYRESEADPGAPDLTYNDSTGS